MYSYQIELQQNQSEKILKVGFNRIQPAQGDQIVKDAVERLEQMQSSGELMTGGLLKIDGPQSVPVAYVLAHKLSHLYETIAVLDPKIGKRGYKTYIVTTVHGSSHYEIGDLIETEETQPEQTKIKVVLCGSPRSGKSCLRDGLKRAILGILGAPYPYVITACPDGEGSWHKETSENNAKLANSLKSSNKSDLNLEFAEEAAKWVKNANQLINIIDVGGMMSPENRIIMKEATHAIILGKDAQSFQEWENFCHDLNLTIIAQIESRQTQAQETKKEDQFLSPPSWQINSHEKLQKEPLLKGVIYDLDRNKKAIAQRLIVQKLAEILNHLTKC